MHIYTNVTEKQFREIAARFIKKSSWMIKRNLIDEYTIMAEVIPAEKGLSSSQKSDIFPTIFIIKMKRIKSDHPAKDGTNLHGNPTLFVLKMTKRTRKPGMSSGEKSDFFPTNFTNNNYQLILNRKPDKIPNKF